MWFPPTLASDESSDESSDDDGNVKKKVPARSGRDASIARDASSLGPARPSGEGEGGVVRSTSEATRVDPRRFGPPIIYSRSVYLFILRLNTTCDLRVVCDGSSRLENCVRCVTKLRAQPARGCLFFFFIFLLRAFNRRRRRNSVRT